jgi:hypothetical protein
MNDLILLQSKQVEISGQIESAEIRLSDAKMAYAQGYVANGDRPRLKADILAADIDLNALIQANKTIGVMVTKAEADTLSAELDTRKKKIASKSKAYSINLCKGEEYLFLLMNELSKADKNLDDIRKLTNLPNISEIPPAWSKLAEQLKEPYGPIATSMAGTVGVANPQFAVKLGMALSNHKVAAIQAKGRKLNEMCLDPVGIIAA